jgi:hypothetical protein
MGFPDEFIPPWYSTLSMEFDRLFSFKFVNSFYALETTPIKYCGMCGSQKELQLEN